MPRPVSPVWTPLPERIKDARRVLSGYNGPQAQDYFARTAVPFWVGQLASASPFAVLGSLARLAWHAGEITVLQRHLQEAHLPHIVGAMLAVAEDVLEHMPVRCAAIRAAVMLSPSLAAPRLGQILRNRGQPRDLRVAVAEAYAGERVPEEVREAVLGVISREYSPAVVAAAMRVLPSFVRTTEGLQQIVRHAFDQESEQVYDAAAVAVRQIIAATPYPEYVPENVELMLNQVRFSIEMIPRETVPLQENQGLYMAERLGEVALPMLEALVSPGHRSHPDVVAAVKPVIQRIKSGAPRPPNLFPAIVLSTPPMSERLRTADAQELAEMWVHWTWPLKEEHDYEQRLRELGPEAWAALRARFSDMDWDAIEILRPHIGRMAADAVMAFPFLAPHGRDADLSAQAVLAWRAGIEMWVPSPEAPASAAAVRADAAARTAPCSGRAMEFVESRGRP